MRPYFGPSHLPWPSLGPWSPEWIPALGLEWHHVSCHLLATHSPHWCVLTLCACGTVPAAPNNLPFKGSPWLAPLSPSGLCSNVTSQVWPSLATPFKTAHSTLSLHPILLPCFLLSPPDTQYILLFYFLSPPIECTFCKGRRVLVLLM